MHAGVEDDDEDDNTLIIVSKHKQIHTHPRSQRVFVIYWGCLRNQPNIKFIIYEHDFNQAVQLIVPKAQVKFKQVSINISL